MKPNVAGNRGAEGEAGVALLVITIAGALEVLLAILVMVIAGRFGRGHRTFAPHEAVRGQVKAGHAIDGGVHAG